MLLVCTGASASHRVFDRCHVVANGSFRCRRPGRRQLCRSGNSAGSGLEEQELRKARPPRQPDQLLRADEPLTEPGHSGPVVGMDPFIAVGNPFVGNPSSVTDVILDYKGSLQLLGTSLLDVEATISCVLSVIIVGACHHNLLETGSQGLNANPNGGFLSFAVVFPLTFSLAEAFKRRETALVAISQVKSNIVAVWHGVRDWDWPAGPTDPGRLNGGRLALPVGFVDLARGHLRDLIAAQRELLLLPIISRTRELASSAAPVERQRSVAALRNCDERVADALDSLSATVEVMKAAGLPANEASRLRMYVTSMTSYWEILRSLKRYRTPQTTRAFSRIYALLHPLFMGPYYAHVSTTVSDVPALSLGFALGLAIATSLCLSALFSTRYRLEDPFAAGEADTVNVGEEFADLALRLRK